MSAQPKPGPIGDPPPISAFPLPDGSSPGMDLRDYFAALFAQEISTIPGTHIEADSKGTPDDTVCIRAYQLADAMMRARAL